MPPPEELEARSAPVGLGIVDRYLPGHERRMIGPWCFLDVFGRHPGPDSGVGPHPHIGIQTVTWLYTGASTHRDSLGSVATVHPGGLSLMTAGEGVAHAEEAAEPGGAPVAGAQLWIALPDEARRAPPGFALYGDLPRIAESGATLALFAGSLGGLSAPGRFHSPIVGASLALASGSQMVLPVDAAFEHGLLAFGGDLVVDGRTLAPGALSYLPPGLSRLALTSEAGADVLLIGGAPFEEPLLMWWNFVARDDQEIREAHGDWQAGRRFGEVSGSSLGRVVAPPLPAVHLRPRARLR